jgi:hypothetical protein
VTGDPAPQQRRTRHLIRFPCDASLMTSALTLALTWALTSKLGLYGPVTSPMRRLN